MPAWQAYNPLLRYGTFAGSDMFPDVDYGTLNELHPLLGNTSIFVFNGGHGHWKRLSLGEGIKRTRLMYLLETDAAGSEPSDKAADIAAYWNDIAGVEYYDKYVAPLLDPDTDMEDYRRMVVNENKSQKHLRDVKGHNAMPVFFHHVHDLEYDGTLTLRDSGVEFTRQFGQITEENLSTATIVAALRAIKRSAQKNGVTSAQAYASILGLSESYVTTTVADGRGIADTLHFDAADLADDQFVGKLQSYYQILRTDETGAPRARPDLPTKDFRQPNLGAFLSALPNGPFEALEAIAPHLERSHAADPENTNKLIQTITDKHAQYKDNVGLSRAFGSKAVQFLRKVGFKADSPLDAIPPKIDETHLEAASKLALSTKEQGDNKDYVPSDADFSKARHFTGSVQFAAIPDAQNDRAGQKIARLQTGDNSKGRYIPVDATRFRALKRILNGLTSEDTWALFEFFRLPVDVPTMMRLDDMGVKLFAASADRICKELVTYSLIALRSNGETLFTMMQPIRAAATARGVGGITDTTIATGTGCVLFLLTR